MTLVVTEKRPESSVQAGQDRALAALEFLYGLLKTPESTSVSLAELLAKFAESFAAAGAGLRYSLRGVPIATHHYGPDQKPRIVPCYPWEEREELVEQITNATTAIRARCNDGSSWLIAGSWSFRGVPVVCWVDDRDQRSWTAGEGAALTLAAQCIERLGGASDASPWQRALQHARLQAHLEQAAVITNRLAHDFGNLLTGINGFAELGLSQLPSDSMPHRYIAEVVQAGRNGCQWIQKLQHFGRRRAAEFWPTTLAAVVGEEEARLRAAWSGKVALHAALAADLPAIALDKESLRTVLGQLLDNAREAIADQGVVTVTANLTKLSANDCQEILGRVAPGTYVQVIITDTGCGLSPETRQRLFADLFYSSKPRHRGLGLAMAYGMLCSFHGGMRLGPHPQQGTAVHVFLPLAPVTGRTMLPGQPSGPRLLIVDDPQNVRGLTMVLERAGYRVTKVDTALDAVKIHLAATEPFALVIADRRLAQESGFDLVGRLRETQPKVNALLLSEDPAASQRALADGFAPAETVSKPFRPENLLQTIQKILETKQSTLSPSQRLGTEKST